MVDRQPDDDPVIQDFLQQFKISRSPPIWRVGRSGHDNEVERKYVSLRTLQQVLTHERIENLLQVLFRGWDEPFPDAGIIRKSYLRSFAILLCIGAGRFIYHFKENHTLRDGQLPFYAPPHNFPTFTTRNLFAEFEEAQWAFCPFELEWDSSYNLGTREILPINSKSEIEDGGSAVVWRVEVDEDYDKLIPLKNDQPKNEHLEDNDRQQRHTYVLKTYRTQEAQRYYETERDAFRRLRYHRRPPPNIIEFYGSFVRNGTYNIILEYADLKTLDEFMKSQRPPQHREERYIFWERFMGVINGLLRIHGEDESEEGLQIFHGWHQDVNPANILVKSRGGTSVYDSDFKVADLGLSHFKKHHPSLRDPLDRDTFGTSAYGPPESRRSDVKLEMCKLQVKKDVDIWSLGCVLSEVATWVHEGWTKLDEYRRRRCKEMKGIFGHSEDCFHDGNAILWTVQEIHADIIENRRANDNITHKVVEDMVSRMLLIREGRSSAKYLYDTSIKILREAKPALTENEQTSIYNPGFPSSSNEGNEVRLPLGWNRYSSGGSTRSGLRSSEMSSQYSYEPHNGDGRYADEDRKTGTYSNTQTQACRDSSGRSDTLDSRTRPNILLHSDSAHRDQPLSSPSQTRTYRLSDHRPYSQQVDHQQRPRERSTCPVDISYGSGALIQSERGQSTNINNTEENLRQGCPIESKDVQNQSGADLSHLQQHEISSTLRQQQKKPRPEMSVEEGLSFTQDGSRRNLPHPKLFETLDKRDHAFLIDNSESMAPHRCQVRNTLKLLAHMLGPSDPDGLEIYFTTDWKKIKPKDVKSLLKEFDQRPNAGTPDMREHFASFTEKYQDQFGKRNIWSKIRHPRSTPHSGPRRLNLYVLTDGVWQPRTTLTQEIKTLVNHLSERKLTNKQIGIQFIRFGTNPQGIRRLQKLDSDMGLKLDIVDTTAANGNVWKMVLGPINAWWDDDKIEGDDDDMEDED